MGYVENLCQLCGVSFAIARIRRPDEPASAGWDYSGRNVVDDDTSDCGEECGRGGCQFRFNESMNTVEHIAGPGCGCEKGYSGHRVTLEEMSGCRAIQCLIEKENGWEPEADDQDFEIESPWFLTGVGDGSPDAAPLEDIKPVRHGVNECWVSNLYFDDELNAGLPFHPTCFEIFKKISRRESGTVDVEGLWYWRKGYSYKEWTEGFPHDPEVRSGQDEFWEHEAGSEYLVANPIEIPGFQAALKQTERIIHPIKAPLGLEKIVDIKRNDGFHKLSAELNNMILDHLGSKDIASLRIATPAFRTLPNILFRRLLLEELPWIWEAESMHVGKTDWHQFFCLAKHEWNDAFKGVKNRKRIWKAVEEVMRKIEQLRKENKVGESEQ